MQHIRRDILKKNKKASVSLYLSFIIFAVIIIMIAAIAAPFGVLFTTEMYTAGEDILEMANESIQSISDSDVKDSVQSGLNNAFAAQENNIEVSSDIYQYGWVFIIILSGLVVFLYTRRLTEIGQII